jgi:multidrug resistance efflux pump
MKTFLAKTFGAILTLAIVACACGAGLELWRYYMDAPWTRDARVRADVVGIAPDVSGLVSDVFVKDDQTVARGAPLFRLDQARFEIAVEQAEAILNSRKATMDNADADAKRYSALSANAVSDQRKQQAVTEAEVARAAMRQAQADLKLTKLNLERSTIRASVDGKVTNFELRPGDYVSAGRAVAALIDTDSLYVAGYFEETKLGHIAIGDPANVVLMGADRTLRGHVVSIAGGIEDRERSTSANLLANVNPTFSWVRLAQRVPVRVKLDDASADSALVSGRSATIEIVNGATKPLFGLLWPAARGSSRSKAAAS